MKIYKQVQNVLVMDTHTVMDMWCHECIFL